MEDKEVIRQLKYITVRVDKQLYTALRIKLIAGNSTVQAWVQKKMLEELIPEDNGS